MNALKSYFLPDFSSEQDLLLGARLGVLHSVCLITGIVSAIFTAAELVVVQNELHSLAYVWANIAITSVLLVLAGIVSRGKFLKPISVLVLVMIYSSIMWMRIKTGIFLPGAAFFIALPVLGGLLLGARSILALTILMVVTYVGMYLFQVSFPAPSRAVSEEEFKLQTILNYSLLGVTAAALIYRFTRVTEVVITRLKGTNVELSTYKLYLEQMVDERTETVRQQTVELTDALEAQKQANALQNTLVSVVSHEIRTPLAIIDGSARRLSKHSDSLSPDDIETRAETIRSSVKRLTQLMERTLESARYAEGAIAFQPSTFDLGELCREVIDRETTLTKSHTIELDTKDLPKNFCGDRNLLDHVFSNLISNAMKYSPEKSVINIRSQTRCDGVTIHFRDHGVGISKEELPQISKRFFRASTSKGIGGTGVGLFLSKRIVEDHAGTISIDSKEGEWTEVSVNLPLKTPLCGRTDCPVFKAA